jgi:hypothetical protein
MFGGAWNAVGNGFCQRYPRREGIAAHVPMTSYGLKQAIRYGEIHDGFTLSTIALADALGFLA